MASKLTLPNEDDLVRRYIAGESEKALAEAFGISRSPIRRVLLEAGVPIRGRGDAMTVRMGKTSRDERMALTEAAHAAARGSVRPESSLIKKAQTVEARLTNVSPAEVSLTAMLRARGLSVIQQKAVGKYNVDIATGTVAVEVLGGSWHRAKKHRERLRYLLESGWDVIYVWVDGRLFPLGSGAAEYVVAHVKSRERNPTAGRCYRVIRGPGQFLSGGEDDGEDLPLIIPNSDRPDVAPSEVPFGYCHCGCGNRTPIADRTVGRRVRGQPTMFISGHNNPR